MDSVLPNRSMVSGLEIRETQRHMPAHGPKMEANLKRGRSRHTDQARVPQSPRSSGDTRVPGGARPTRAPREEVQAREPGPCSTPSRRAGNKSKTKLQTHCCLQWNISSRLQTTEEPPLSSLGVCVDTVPASPRADSWSTGPGRGKVTTRPSWWERKINAETRKKNQNCLLKTVMRQKSNPKNKMKSQMLEKRKSNPISEREERGKMGRNLYPDLKERLICVCFSKKQHALSSRRFPLTSRLM